MQGYICLKAKLQYFCFSKTCPQESLVSSLSDTVASEDEDKIKLCKEICLETDNCRAFSILFRVGGVTQVDKKRHIRMK